MSGVASPSIRRPGVHRQPVFFVKLNGIDDAAGAPTKAKAVYAHGQRFTGIVEITWATLLIARDADFCTSYNETDRFGDHHIVQLLEARQAPPVDRIAAVYDIFG